MPTPVRTEDSVARSLAEAGDLQQALIAALNAIGVSLGWRLGAAWESPIDRPETLRCVEVWHREGVDAREFEQLNRSIELTVGEGLPGRVWESGEPEWIADVSADANFPRRAQARRAGLRAAFCFPVRSASGVLGVIEFFTGELREPDRELLSTMTTLGDLIGQTLERRRDAEALRYKDARYRAMLDTALDPIVTIDHQGCVLDFNAAAERTFGYRAAEVRGREMAELIIPPELRARHRNGLERYLRTLQPTMLNRRIELTAMRADGSLFPVELAITRADVPGSPAFAGYLRDITERKRAESELRSSRARIVEAADTARRRLERDLHDGAQQRLVQLSQDLRRAVAELDRDAGRARELLEVALEDVSEATRELRELARGIHPAALTHGGLAPALRALVARAGDPVRLLAAPKARFTAAAEATAYFTVAEALTNAVRYAHADSIEVAAGDDDGTLWVEVRDNGRGGAELGAGTGLTGLADRLTALDGRLAVDSVPGSGTVVRAEIPCGS